jgi:hypothetical protein
MPTNDTPIVNFAKGSVVRLRTKSTDPFAIAGVATDPTSVIVRYRDPVGVIVVKTYNTDPEVKKSSTGQYYIDIPVTVSGEWFYRFEGTAAPQVAAESSFWVEPSKF